tara:strand:- start:105 stop:443 length:339 start_codon:yes stop_codon:yes gene_type:complete
MNDLYIQPEDNINMINQFPQSLLLSKIDELETHYNINMEKDLFESNNIPLYFNVKQNNLNTVTYEFEVDEGSAQITVINFNSEFSETWETNDILETHMYNSRHDAFDDLDSL